MFKIKDLGELNYFLGMEVINVPNGTILTQRKFILDLLKEFQCDMLLATTCPLGPLSRGPSNEDNFADVTSYRKLVRKLNSPILDSTLHFQCNTSVNSFKHLLCLIGLQHYIP